MKNTRTLRLLHRRRDFESYEPRLLLTGDFDNDGLRSVADVDSLIQGIVSEQHDPRFDLTSDALVDLTDLDRFLQLSGSFRGDTNLDQQVDFDDFLALSDSYFQPGSWANGDSDASGFVDFADFLRLSSSFGMVGDAFPLVSVSLDKDTARFGLTNADGITSNAIVVGRVTDDNSISSFLVRVDDGAETFIPLGPDGGFAFSPNFSADGTDDGGHRFEFTAQDDSGNELGETLEITLDTVPPATPTVGLSPISDSAPIGDGATSSNLVTLDGQIAEQADSRVVIGHNSGRTADIQPDGSFALAGVPLQIGSNSISVFAEDLAGNRAFSTELPIQRLPTEGAVLLAERSNFVTEQEVDVELGQAEGSRTVRFHIDAAFDTTDNNSVSTDLFSVYLVDSNDPTQTLLDRGDNGTALLTVSEAGSEFVPGLVQFDGEVASIDLTSLGDLATAKLRFQLLNLDDDNGTQVAVSGLQNVVDAEGRERPVFAAQDFLVPIGSAIAAPLALADDVSVRFENSRYDSISSEYKTELSVETATDQGRSIAVAFPDLPPGVQLQNASGIVNGSPYLSMASGIPAGGLAAGDASSRVLITISNPGGATYALRPQVFVGPQNRAPTIEAISTVTIIPGEVLEIPVQVNDSDGDEVTLQVQSNVPLPNVTVQSDNSLVIAPRPDQLGSFDFTIVATDGRAEATHNVTVNVVADQIGTTRLSGTILNTDQQPLVGVPIEFLDLSTTTNAEGYFTLDFGASVPVWDDALIVRGEALAGPETYPYIAEKLHLITDTIFPQHNNELPRPIYLPALNIVDAVDIDPAANTNVSVALREGEGASEVFVAANSLEDQSGNPYDGELSISEVPAALTPAALPPAFLPDTVVTIQPGEMSFMTPAPLTLPNRSGLAPGTKMDLWSINPVTGEFDDVGDGEVSADGSVINTISGGIRNSSWHFFSLDLLNVDFDQPNDLNKHDACDDCEELLAGTSAVRAHSGEVVEWHDLVTYQSLGTQRGVRLVYNSLRADPRPIVHDVFSLNLDPTNGGGPGFPNVRLVSSLSIGDGNVNIQVPGAMAPDGSTNNTHYWRPGIGGIQSIALQADLSTLETGRYEYEMSSGFVVIQDGSISQSSGVRGRSSGELIHVNSIDSEFGAGWGISGLSRLAELHDGSILHIDGDGSEFVFDSQPDGSFVSPPGHFGKLERLQDGTFRHTTTEQTVSSFDQANRLVSIADRNGNTTAFSYANGVLSSITDPVGLVTEFNYTNGKLSSIVDPANRTTQFEYDTSGNLTRVIDPDGTSRNWEYDDRHLIVAEIDKRGFREEMAYDFAGRAMRATRKDGSILQYRPAQVVGLSPPHLTANPDTAPSTSRTGEAMTQFVDGNGVVQNITLDNTGQKTGSEDSEGPMAEIVYNSELLPTSITDARGFRTDYGYDDRGNVTTILDDIASGGDSGGTSYASPSILVDAMVLGDINGDGAVDLITNVFSQILLNSNAGGFISDAFLEYPNFDIELPRIFRVVDMNGDGIDDIVASSALETDFSFGGSLFVWLANPDGSFDVATEYATSIFDVDLFERDPVVQPGMAVADFNGDTLPDVILTQPFDENGDLFSTYIYLENDGGGGLLDARPIFESGPEFTLFAWSVEAADINHDGNQDLLVTNASIGGDVNHQLTVLLGDGFGGFDSTLNYDLGFQDEGGFIEVEQIGEFLALEDFNLDGEIDVVVASMNEGVVSVVLGDGTGGFGGPEIVASDSSAFNVTWNGVETGDFNGDGIPDVASANFASKEIAVMLGNGDGTFQPRTDYLYDTPNLPFAVSKFDRVDGLLAIDMNGDGHLDLATPSYNGNDFAWLVNNGDGTFQSWNHIPDVAEGDDLAPEQVETVDLNGDNLVDILTLSDLGAEVRFNQGNQQFSGPVSLNVSGRSRGLSLYDFDANGTLDVLIPVYDLNATPRGIRHYFFNNNGDGSFSAPTVFDPGFEIGGDTAVGDFNNDDVADLFVTDLLDLNTSTVRHYRGDGSGGYTQQGTTTFQSRFLKLDAADVNNDDNLDLIVSRLDDGNIAILLGDGSGSLGAPASYSAANTEIDIADINDDGYVDIAFTGFNNNVRDAAYLLNDGTGKFSSPNYLGVGQEERRFVQDDVEFVTIGEVNGDGVADIVASSATHFHVVTGVEGGGFSAPASYRGGGFAPAMADLDGDDVIDIVNVRTQAQRVGDNDHHGSAISINYGIQQAASTPATFTFDPVFNQLTSAVDELGRQTLYQIDPTTGDTTAMIEVIGQPDSTSGETDDLVTQYRYNLQGQIEGTTDPIGRVTEFEYDSLGRMTRVTNAMGTPDEATTHFEYDAAGNLVRTIDANQNATRFTYDALNRPKSLTDPFLATAAFEYDAEGNLVETTDRAGNTVINEYDPLNRLVRSRDDQFNVTQFAYDQSGNVSSTIDPLGQQVRFEYDGRNRLTSAIDPAEGETLYRYDATDNLTLVVDPVGNRSQFLYDARNRQTAEIDPLGNTILYEYDRVDDLVRMTDRNGRSMEYQYDDVSRMIQETWIQADNSTANTVGYEYDKVGNLLTVQDDFSSLSWTYDARNRVTTESNTGTPGAPAVQLSYTYDDVGNLLSMSENVEGVAGAVTQYQYDALNRMESLTQFGAGGLSVAEKRVDFSYNAIGQFSNIMRYSNLAGTSLVIGSAYTYDSLNRLQRLAHANSATTVAFYDYEYDSEGRLTRITDVDGVTSYSYDIRDQLIGATHSDAAKPDETYSYDANGNRVNSHQHADNYTTDSANRLTSDGTYNYEYDAEGNRTRQTNISDGSYREFTYDHHNRLVSAVDFSADGTPAQTVEFRYDAVGRRISKSVGQETTHYVYSGSDVILDFVDADGEGGAAPELAQRQLHGPAVDQVLAQESADGELMWLLDDHLGSTRDVVDETGQVANHIKYDSYGNVIEQSNPAKSTRYLFTGREYEPELELYYYRARIYDPSVGLFLSEDALRLAAGDTNLARYGFNMPNLLVDPSGYETSMNELQGDFDWAMAHVEAAREELTNNPYLTKKEKDFFKEVLESWRCEVKRLGKELNRRRTKSGKRAMEIGNAKSAAGKAVDDFLLFGAGSNFNAIQTGQGDLSDFWAGTGKIGLVSGMIAAGLPSRAPAAVAPGATGTGLNIASKGSGALKVADVTGAVGRNFAASQFPKAAGNFLTKRVFPKASPAILAKFGL